MARLSLDIDDTLRDKIKAAARRQGRSMTAHIRHVMEQSVGQPDDPAVRELRALAKYGLAVEMLAELRRCPPLEVMADIDRLYQAGGPSSTEI